MQKLLTLFLTHFKPAEAPYADGVVPAITHPATSIDAALMSMRTCWEGTTEGNTQWNKAGEINGNVPYSMAPAEHFCGACRNHAARINEMRVVRNYIMHGNAGTRREFQSVVRRRLGGLCHVDYHDKARFVLREFSPGIILLVEYVVTLGAVISGRCYDLRFKQ